MCPSNYYRFWDTARYLWKNRHFIIAPLHSTPPLGGFRRNIGTPIGTEKLEWCRYPMVKKISKISLFVLTWSTNVTDGRTDRRKDGHCMTAKTALASHRAVKTNTFWCAIWRAKSRMHENETTGQIVTNFCTGVGVHDVITSANFYDSRVRGFGVVGVWVVVKFLASPLTCIVTFTTLSDYRASVWLFHQLIHEKLSM